MGHSIARGTFRIPVLVQNHNGFRRRHGFQGKIKGIAQISGKQGAALAISRAVQIILYIGTAQHVSGSFGNNKNGVIRILGNRLKSLES